MLKNENGSQASNQKPGQGPKPSRTYKIKIDGTMYEVQNRSITGRGLLELAKKTPIENFGVAIKLQGQNMKALEMDEVVDLEAPGLEKFVTYHIAHSDGEGPQGPYVFRTISVQCSGDTRSLLSGKDRLLATKLILFS